MLLRWAWAFKIQCSWRKIYVMSFSWTFRSLKIKFIYEVLRLFDISSQQCVQNEHNQTEVTCVNKYGMFVNTKACSPIATSRVKHFCGENEIRWVSLSFLFCLAVFFIPTSQSVVANRSLVEHLKKQKRPRVISEVIVKTLSIRKEFCKRKKNEEE